MGLLDFLSLNKNAPDLAPAYTAIMAQARKPDHYGAGAVPDSFDGRFDMLAVLISPVVQVAYPPHGQSQWRTINYQQTLPCLAD